MLILNPKTGKFAPAQVAQIMTYFQREMLLYAKTPKCTFARVAQIMTNF